jgi:hypothetical protein
MTSTHYDRVKQFLLDLALDVSTDDRAGGLMVVSDEAEGILNLMVVFEEQSITLAQHILNLADPANAAALARLLQLNNLLPHGAFALDDTGARVIWRDTLELETLDFEELAASVHALSLAMAEHGAELAGFAQLTAAA